MFLFRTEVHRSITLRLVDLVGESGRGVVAGLTSGDERDVSPRRWSKEELPIETYST